MNKIIKIIILSIFVVLLSVAMVLLIEDKDNKYLNLIHYESELILEEEFDNVDISSFNIVTESSDVIVTSTNDDIVSIKIYGDKNDEINAYVKDGKLYIDNDNSINICFFFCVMNSKIEIFVPKEEYEDIKIESISGDIKLNNLIFNNIEASSKSGNVTFNKAKNADINLVSGNIKFKELDVANLVNVSGNITGDIINDITAETISGDINIENIEKTCQITTTSGNINFSMLNLLYNSNITTISGNTRILKANDIYVDVSTLSGNINIEDNNRFSKIELKITTTSGNVNISK